SPDHRLYLPGGGGAVYYRTDPDAAGSGHVGQLAFYGLQNYYANPTAYLANVYINTPLTADAQGNLYFGFLVTGATPLNLQSGVARISRSGKGTWVAAGVAAGDPDITQVALNCAPALSRDGRVLYVAVIAAPNPSYGGPGYLVGLDSRTLAPVSRARL